MSPLRAFVLNNFARKSKHYAFLLYCVFLFPAAVFEAAARFRIEQLSVKSDM